MTKIEPFDKVTTKVIDSFNVDSVDITLFNSAKIRVSLLNKTNVIDVSIVILEGDDYANWGNDDNYIVNYVAKKLGFTIIY